MANPHREDRSTEDAARRTGEKTAEQATRIGQAAAEQTTRMGQAAAEAGQEVARASAHLLQQNAETLQNAWRVGLDTAAAVMGRSTDQLGRTLGLSGTKRSRQLNARFATSRAFFTPAQPPPRW
jgi:hypothetical protein